MANLIRNITLVPLQPRSLLWFISVFLFPAFLFTFFSAFIVASFLIWFLLLSNLDHATVYFNLREDIKLYLKKSSVTLSIAWFSSAIILQIEQRGGAEIYSCFINDLVSKSCKGILLAPVCFHWWWILQIFRGVIVIAKNLSTSLAIQSYFSSVAAHHNQHRHIWSCN